ncbi:MAG: [FeFe] hydrogenase H-cluster maturation GTPase HydF [Candidatus Izemoplasmatales bacterium]
MNKQPTALIPHITIFGKRNVGKSSLLNALANQEVSLVHDTMGTTTDPVKKRMELIPFGPVIFIDTAGLDDVGELGSMRVKKSEHVMMQTDLALLVVDSNNIDDLFIENLELKLKRRSIPSILVFNKSDQVSEEELESLIHKYPKAIFVSAKNRDIEKLRSTLIKQLGEVKEPSIIGDQLKYGDVAILVCPIDSEAPKGRMILPQVQVIRDLLDYGIQALVIRETELEHALQITKNVAIVITDSQAFHYVNQIVPDNIPLTSFSMLFARYKGDFNTLLQGARFVDKLTPSSKILVVESCSHNISHEDIGQIKIPRLLEQKLGFKPQIDFCLGADFPSVIQGYDLIIHCGSCMLNRKTMKSRIEVANDLNIPMVNYGVLISYLTNILDRTTKVFC